MASPWSTAAIAISCAGADGADCASFQEVRKSPLYLHHPPRRQLFATVAFARRWSPAASTNAPEARSCPPISPVCRRAFYAPPEAARFLGLSGRTLEKHRTYGTGPAYRKLGGRVVYAIDDLQAWADRGAVTSTSDPRGAVLPAKRHESTTPVQAGRHAR